MIRVYYKIGDSVEHVSFFADKWGIDSLGRLSLSQKGVWVAEFQKDTWLFVLDRNFLGW